MTSFGTARVIQKLRLIISIQMYKVIRPNEKQKTIHQNKNFKQVGAEEN